jgi:Cdc6-like AAA superfamily ATPase
MARVTQPLLTEEERNALWSDINEAFSPGAPVQERDLFAGRIEQLSTLVDAVEQRGRHALVFGERGVGKTSLVNILHLVTQAPRRHIAYAKLNAEPDDTFTTLWRKIFKRLLLETREIEGHSARQRLMAEMFGELFCDDVQLALSAFPASVTPIIVIDEFDRITDSRVPRMMADTLKALSDYSSSATVVLVGVAEDVADLLEGHLSISRALLQVKMPRMSQEELAQIVQSRYAKSGIKCDEEALWKMTFLARGLPFYAQLVGMHSARVAIREGTRMVVAPYVNTALRAAVNELDQSIKEAYITATRSQRGDTLFTPVLLACALAKGDELGAFQQSAVTEPLNRIIPGKNYRPTTFAFHMNEFCTPLRKQVLERVGEPRSYRYRFTDPLMQPFIIMKGLAEDRIDDVTAEVYANRRQLELSTAW